MRGRGTASSAASCGQSRLQRLAQARGPAPRRRTPRDHGRRRLQADGAEVAGAADVDAPDRCRRRGQPRQHAQRTQRIDAGRGDSASLRSSKPGGAVVRQAGLDQRHAPAAAVQRAGQAAADQAAAEDQDVVIEDVVCGHGAMIRRRGCTATHARWARIPLE